MNENPLNTLRHKVATVVLVARDNPHEAADRILALVAEALLSDDAVEAGAKQLLWATDMDATAHERIREARDEATGVLTAALAAAGITTTGEEAGT